MSGFGQRHPVCVIMLSKSLGSPLSNSPGVCPLNSSEPQSPLAMECSPHLNGKPLIRLKCFEKINITVGEEQNNLFVSRKYPVITLCCVWKHKLAINQAKFCVIALHYFTFHIKKQMDI